MQQQFILCGLGKVGLRVLEQLRAAGADVVVIDNRCRADDPRLGGARLVVGDCRQADVLMEAGILDADGVLILTSDDLTSLSCALTVRQLHPTIRVVVRMFNQSLLERLGAVVGNMQALSTSALAAPLLALIARTGEGMRTTRLGDGRRQQVAEIAVADDSPLVGRRLDELAGEFGAVLIGHQPPGEPMRFMAAVQPDAVLAASDRVWMCAPPERLAPLMSQGENESIPELLWGGTVKRLGRVVARGLALVDWPVKVCTLVFLTVIVISVLVFHLGMRNDTLVDAFYRTISLMVTGDEMHGEDTEPGSWQKFFITGLKLFGLAITAAFTAIFTNYLIRANLGGALEVRRIPECGHVVVCGLGNVGFRAIEELLRHHEPVVAIESNPDNPFIPTARRLGAAVIVGNATVGEVLKQAHAASAAAVIAATSNDLINLEIGLLVRELAPKQRVVLRLIDSELAQTLRQAARLPLAVSIPELAAPAFVAALYGDRVRGVFQVAGRMMAIYEFILQDGDLFLTNGGDADVLILHRLGPDGHDKPLRMPLEPGDRLVVILTLDALREILRGDTIRAAETAKT